MKRSVLFSGLFALSVVSSANAGGLGLFDLESPDGQAAWELALGQAGKQSKGTVDFGGDPAGDYGLTGFAGPLTAAGAGPVSPGVVLENLHIISPNNPGPITGLVGVGPGPGFGNPANAVLANYFTDSLEIVVTGGEKTAFELDVLTLLGGATVDITVKDPSGASLGTLPGLSAPAGGWRYGIISSVPIGSVEIFDPGNGAEGIMSIQAYNAPEPGAFAVLALGSLAMLRRRRNATG